MTDKEIKKALECCATDTCFTNSCPFEDESDGFDISKCTSSLSRIALDLLNRQQAEIERLKDENLQSEYPARIRVDDFLVCANSLGEWLEFCDSLKAEAIKELAERVKMAFYYEFDEIIPSIMADNIDNLVKEMVVMRSESSFNQHTAEMV